MAYFPNNVGFQVPSLVCQSAHSFPDQFYPFESHHLHQLPATDLQKFRALSPTKNCEMVEQVPLQTQRSRARSPHPKGPRTKCPGDKKQKCNAEDNITHQEIAVKSHEDPTTEYIHVRARRGQATDSHSLAERVRREKISERMKTLQALVPGCDKVTGKALMLDQIITYIQSLQTQVQYLSMKLASIGPIHDEEMCQDHTMQQEMNYKQHDIPTMGATAFTEHELESSYLLQQVQRLFYQDGSDEVLPWDLDDQILTPKVIDYTTTHMN